MKWQGGICYSVLSLKGVVYVSSCDLHRIQVMSFNRRMTHTIAALYRHYKQFEKIEEIFSKVFITPLNPDLIEELPKEINEALKKNIKSMHVFYNQPNCPIDQPVAPKGDQLRLRILENLQLVKLMCHEFSQDPKTEIIEHILKNSEINGQNITILLAGSGEL